ncbi:MAG: hypothetical protein WA126_06615 [Thermodesulfovibrionales bacterium]|jgi:hypothetical protein
MEELTYRNQIKEVITILMESPFYLEIPLGERHLLIKKIMEEYHFSTK